MGEFVNRKDVVSKRTFVFALILCFIIAFSSSYAILNVPKTHRPMVSGANVYVTLQTETGLHDLMIGNLITDIGENQTCYAHGGNALNVSWISLGNATPAVGLTQLTTEYVRAAVDSIVYGVTAGGDSHRNITKKFTFTETVTLNCAGANWASSGNGNLWACASFTQTQFANTWNLTITWVGVFDGN